MSEVAPRTKRIPRLTVRGAVDRRMSCSINLTLREVGEPRKYHWSRLCGFRVADMIAHIEKQFVDGMNWERFLAGEIQLDHIVPQSWFPYTSSADQSFKDCWSLANYQPAWETDNKRKGARFASPTKSDLDDPVTSVTG